MSPFQRGRSYGRSPHAHAQLALQLHSSPPILFVKPPVSQSFQIFPGFLHLAIRHMTRPSVMVSLQFPHSRQNRHEGCPLHPFGHEQGHCPGPGVGLQSMKYLYPLEQTEVGIGHLHQPDLYVPDGQMFPELPGIEQQKMLTPNPKQVSSQ